MNYKIIYDNIIGKAKSRGLNKKLLDGYFERHHIIPRCLNGLNNKDNLVLLTAREHYLCHYLLWKIYKENKSLFLAYHKMIFSNNSFQQRNYKISNKQYEILRNENSKRMSERIITDEFKIKMRNSRMGKSSWNKGLKVKSKTIGKKFHSEDFKEKQRLNNIGKVLNESTKLKISKSSKRSTPIVLFNVSFDSKTEAYNHFKKINIIDVSYSAFVKRFRNGCYSIGAPMY